MKQPLKIPKGYEIFRLNGQTTYTVLAWQAEDIRGYPDPVLRLRTLEAGFISRYRAAQWLFRWISNESRYERESHGAALPAV